uniref:Uncharacterized protein n=1 Tax=Arundo donax TaxID=35708 RepID=A0A0A9E0N3_ARUDO
MHYRNPSFCIFGDSNLCHNTELLTTKSWYIVSHFDRSFLGTL